MRERSVQYNPAAARRWLMAGVLMLWLNPLAAQIQHPLAARRIHAHRVHTHRTNVAGAVRDHRQDAISAVHDNRAGAVDRLRDHRQNVVDTRQDRAQEIVGRRTSIAAARAILPSYAPASIAASGSIVVPPAAVTFAEPAATTPPAQEPDDALSSDEPQDDFEGSPSYPVIGVEDDGATAVLKMGQGTAKVRMIGVATVALGDRVNVPERFSGLRLPSTERYLENLLKGENVYVVYDTRVAAEDADKKCVGYLFRAPDGLMINLEVIRAGFAVVDNRYDFDQKATFNKYQDAARTAERGIHGMIQRIGASRAENK